MTDKEHNQRISILKAKVSKMRLGNIYDEQEENKDKGSAASIKSNPKVDRVFNKRRAEMGLGPVDVKTAVKKKTKDQDEENEHNRDNYNAQSSVETGGDY
jgi:hypothetical protein